MWSLELGPSQEYEQISLIVTPASQECQGKCVLERVFLNIMWTSVGVGICFLIIVRFGYLKIKNSKNCPGSVLLF
jgi:hypothetical protein